MSSKEIKVGDSFRSNELSLEEGGATVKIIMTDGRVLLYDKIKSVRSYSQKAAMQGGIAEIWHENTCLYKKG
jgi:hypothetical protein